MAVILRYFTESDSFEARAYVKDRPIVFVRNAVKRILEIYDLWQYLGGF